MDASRSWSFAVFWILGVLLTFPTLIKWSLMTQLKDFFGPLILFLGPVCIFILDICPVFRSQLNTVHGCLELYFLTLTQHNLKSTKMKMFILIVTTNTFFLLLLEFRGGFCSRRFFESEAKILIRQLQDNLLTKTKQ